MSCASVFFDAIRLRAFGFGQGEQTGGADVALSPKRRAIMRTAPKERPATIPPVSRRAIAPRCCPKTKGTGRFPAAARAGAQKIRNHFVGGALASARLLYYFGETYGSDQSE